MRWLFQRDVAGGDLCTLALNCTRKASSNCFLSFLLLLSVLFQSQQLYAQNPISTENALPGNPRSEWDVINAGDPSIQGFATDMSVNKGTTVRFKINVTGTNRNYTIRIYRLGYYQGNGARLVANLGTFSGVTQPSPFVDPVLGLVDCGNWSESASWAVPSTAVSGVYLARLTRADNGGASHITFIVRDDAATPPILFKVADATWQAYNNYGGYSFYLGTTANPEGRASKISYNRPFATRNIKPESFLFNAEYPMIRWMERNGYNMTYTTDVDMERNTALITPAKHKVLLSVGHDEYWSANMRNNFENARNAGVHLAFFSGNEVYWKTRWENNTRTLVCYKEGATLGQGEFNCGGNCDPLPGVWTGLWRFGCEYGEDGCRPENALTGQLSWTESSIALQVPYAYRSLPFWRNTSVASLQPGQVATMTNYTLGYEWNYEQPEFAAYNPPGRITMSSTTYNGKTHQLSMYTHSSGAIVFGAGTVQWSWGLDDEHDRERPAPSRDMQQATLNLLLDMGVMPATVQAGLIISGGSADQTPPSSIINSPSAGFSATAGTALTISGTASDASGISRVEVSVDGGLTWQAATGTTGWSYPWTPSAGGSVTIKSRAIDNNGNVEPQGTPPSANAINGTVTGGSGNCPCTIFTNQLPAISNQRDNTLGIVIGTRFRSNVNGTVTGIRFYKGVGNTGTHTGQLWTSSGTLLAQATFTNETSSGWQQVNLSTPVAITAGVQYIVSYHSSQGYYSTTNNFFASALTNGPLTAPADATGANNGLYKYSSAPVFPNETYQKESYFVDVVFSTAAVTDQTPPSVSAQSPAAGATGVSTSALITADFNEALDPSSVNTSSVLLTAGAVTVASTVSYSAVGNRVTITPSAPLAAGTTYTVTLEGGTAANRIRDLAGNSMGFDYSWTFTTAAVPVQTGNCPCTLFTNQLPYDQNKRDNTMGIVLGMRFFANSNGNITALKFYKGVGNTGTHIGQLWTSGGTLLAQATYTNETASGWQQVNLPAPVAITAGTHYIVSYYSSDGYYSARGSYFNTPLVNGPLTAPASTAGAFNGVYKYSNTPVFPNETYNQENYYVDVVFNNGMVTDNTPPTVVSASPVTNATGVAIGTTVTAQFSEALDPATLTSASAYIQRGGTTVGASVSYNNATSTLTLTPSSVLLNSTVYTVTLKGGTTGTIIRDAAGNAMVSDYVWSFTTAAAAADNTPPVSAIASPVNGATLTVGQPLTISGTASDAGGLNRVEVSVNNGSSWQTATGTANWSYAWTPATTGAYTIRSRAVDNAGNVEANGALPSANAITVSVNPVPTGPCPCTVFGTANPSGSELRNDGQALSLGMKFTASVSGYITGFRFYKAPGNTGTHTGMLHSLSGTLLAQAVFTGETASGWQQVNLATPVAVTAGTVYVVSYHSSSGYYSTTPGYFSSAVTNGYLRALANGENGGNGLYRYSATPVMPVNTYNSANYWVDVVFNTVISPASNRNGTGSVDGTEQVMNRETGTQKGTGFFLWQNAPNPSPGKTLIRYTLPEKAMTTLTLHDMQGRMIQVLRTGEALKGNYQYELDTKPLVKGMYYYKLISGNHQGVRRLIVE